MMGCCALAIRFCSQVALNSRVVALPTQKDIQFGPGNHLVGSSDKTIHFVPHRVGIRPPSRASGKRHPAGATNRNHDEQLAILSLEYHYDMKPHLLHGAKAVNLTFMLHSHFYVRHRPA